MNNANDNSPARRHFLRQLGAGAAVISMPAWLAGCATPPLLQVQEELPENPFLAWFGIDQAQLARIMSELTARGATFADIYLQHRRSHSLQLTDGVAGVADITLEQGAGLRVVVNGQTGFAATEDLTLAGMLDAAGRAASLAAASQVKAPAFFAEVEGPDRYPVVTAWTDVANVRRRAIIERAAALAQAADAAVSTVAVDWQDVDERVVIATLDGNLVTDQRPLTRLSLQVAVQRGSERHEGFASMSARQGIDWFDEAGLSELAQTAVGRALQRFDARQPPLGEMPVILAAGTSGILLHEALGHALEADFGAAGAGPYSGRLGEQVASPLVTVIDDATLAHERGALNFDDEGVAGQRNVLIEGGVLHSFLHDRISAAAAGVSPTGNGRRESYRFSPMPRMCCTRLANGAAAPAELTAAAGNGLLVETYSPGSIDPLSGDFSFRIKTGRYIEAGRLSYPVRDLTLSGNGPALLGQVQLLANDGRMDAAGWTCGKRGQRVPVSHGMPSALISGLRVSL